MGKVSTVISWLLLTGGAVSAQTARLQEERLLPQWLTGIIAVTVFLFLVFVAFLVNKAWCDKSRRSAGDSVKDADFATSNGAAYDRRVDAARMLLGAEGRKTRLKFL
ncbi:PDZK1-interacting protein 1 [Centroberyx affinis]|uniref:PDZK1-interacting protein 1 n=1 Tax=Centroberyx affinis TaxID=166261 RepID=UPI003A5BD4A6